MRKASTNSRARGPTSQSPTVGQVVEVKYLVNLDKKQAVHPHQMGNGLKVALLLNDFMPLSKLMSEQMDGLRKRAKGRARRATALAEKRPERRLIA